VFDFAVPLIPSRITASHCGQEEEEEEDLLTYLQQRL